MNDKIQQLYNALEGDYNLGSIEDFTAYLQDESKRKMFYEQVIAPRYNVESLQQFESVYGLDVKKKDSIPLEERVDVTESVTEEVPVKDTLSALQSPEQFQFGEQVEETPIPLRPEEEAPIQYDLKEFEETKDERDIFDPMGVDEKAAEPTQDLILSPEIPQEKLDAYDAKFNEKLEEIKQSAINDGIIEDLGTEEEVTELGDVVVQDKTLEQLYEKIPDVNKKVKDAIKLEQEVTSSEIEAVGTYDKLSDEIKERIEPAVRREDGKVVGLDYSLLSKDDIEFLIEESKKTVADMDKGYFSTSAVKDILDNYVAREKISYNKNAQKATNLATQIKETDEEINKLKANSKFAAALELESYYNEKVNEYNNIAEETIQQSILINAAEIAEENVSMNAFASGTFKAVESFLSLGAQALPSLAATGLNLASSQLPGNVRLSVPQEKRLMKWSMDTKRKIEKFIPTDFDDTKANFVGDVVGQIGFIVGSSALGGTPLAIAAGYTMSMGEMYEEAVANGLDHDDAMNLSMAYGAISAPFEVWATRAGIDALAGKTLRKKVINEVLEKGAKGFTKEFAEQTVKQSIKPIIKETSVEALEEGLQEGGQYMLSKGLAETYNIFKDKDKPEFEKTDLFTTKFLYELGQNILLGAAGGAIGGASLNILGGNVYVGNNYKGIEKMFLNPKQMSKVNDQLTAYRKSGKIKTDEDLQLAREQVGIIQSAAAEVDNATKATDINDIQKKKLFQLTAERLSLQKEVEGVTIPSLVADKKQRMADIDKNIEDVITGKKTIADIVAEEKEMTAKTEAETVVSKDVELTEELKQEVKDIEAFFADSDKKISENLAVNKEEKVELSEAAKQTTDFAQKASSAISSILPNTKIVLHNTTEEYTPFKSAEGISRGEYNPQTNTIHIDLSVADSKTVAHEVFHAVLLNKIKTEEQIQTATKGMYDSVKQSLAAVPEISTRIENFSKMYEDNLQSEEALAELTGILASEYKQLNEPTKLRVKKWVNDIASFFGLDNVIKLTKDEEVIELLNTLSAKVATGEQVTEKDIKAIKAEPTVVEDEFKKFVDTGEVSQKTLNRLADIVQKGEEIKDKEDLAIYTAKVAEINKILSDRKAAEETEQGTGGEVGTIKVPRQQKIEVVEAPNVENDNRPWVRDVLEMLDLNEIDGAKFITNMYDYTNAGATDLGNGFSIELLGGRNYVPLIMEKTGRKMGDVSNLAAFNTKSQAETFIRNSKEGKANLFAPHSGTLDQSWQFQQHIFEQLVNLVLDKKILSNKKLIDTFNDGLKSKNGKAALAKFNQKNKSNLKNLNSFKSNPKELVRLLDIENNFSPDLRKILNTKIASDKTFQKAIGVKNLNEFYGRIADPLNIGISGGEVMTIIKFDSSTFEVAKTNPGDVDHHPSFGWTVKAKIENIYQPTKFFKSYDITEEYTKFNIDGTSVSKKADVTEKEFAQKNVLSSAGAIPKVATVATRQQRISDEDIESVITEARNNNFTDEAIKYYLVNVKKQPATKVNELLEVNVNLLDRMPKSFGNIEGGAAKGVKLFEKVQKYHTKLNKNNNKRKPANRLNEQQIVDEVIKFLEKQPEYKKEGFPKKKEISTQQAAMLSDIQKSVRMRPTAEMAEKIREARMVLAQRKKGIADIKKVQSAVRNFMRKALPKKLYTKSETLKLINKINDATVKNIDAVIAEVEKFVIEQNIKDLNAKVSNLLDISRYTKTQAGKKVAKGIDSETLKRVEYINKNILSNKATAEQIDAKNAELNREFNEISAKTNLTVADVQRMSDISIITGYNNSLQMDNQDATKVTQLDSVIAQLEGVIEYGSSQLAERIAEQKRETDRIFEVGYKAVTGTDIDLSAENANQVLEDKDFEFEYQKERKRLRSKLSNLLSEIGTSIKESMFGTAEALDGLMDKINILPAELFGGDLQELFTNMIDEATRIFKERRMMAETTIKNKLVELYGKRWVNESRKNRNTINTGIYINEAAKKKDMPIMLSQNQMAYYYNQYKDPANRASFANTFGPEYERVMEEMTNKLDPKVKQLADWQVDEFYPSLYKYYNDAYKKIYNADMPWNQFYAGILYRKGETIEPLDLLADKTIYNTAVGANSTKSRVQNNNKIEGMDMVDVMATYINQMEYFAAYSQPIREMNTFFKNKYIRNAIETIHNKQTMKFIDAMIEKIANKGGKQEFGDEFVNALNSTFVTSRIGLSPVVMIKQLLSIPTYANDIGIRNWTKYSAKNATQLAKTWKEVRDNSVYMQDRRNDSILRTIETYKDSDMVEFVPNPTKRWLVDFLMYTTKFGDRTAIMLGGMPNYLYYKDQELKKGKTEQQAIDIAIKKFERDTKRTQQSADLQDKDYFQTKGAITRALNMFLTTPKQYLRKEIQAVRNLGRMMSKSDKAGKGTAWQNLRTLGMYHFFLPVLFQYVALGLPGILREWRDDEDDKDLWRAAILGNLNALFLYGEIFAAAGDLLTGKPWAGEQTRTVGLIQSSMNVIKKLKKAMTIKDEDKKEKAQKDAILELLNMTGAPASTVDRMIQNYKEIGTDDDLGKDIMRVLNYSKYQIEGPKKKKQSFAGASTTSMTDLKEYAPTLYDEIKALEKELKVDID